MRNRGVFVLLLVIALLLAALAARSGRVALLAMPLLAYLAVAAWRAPEPGGVRLSAARSLDRRFSGPAQPVEVRLELANQGERLDHLRLVDRLPARAQAGAPTCRRAALAGGENLTLSYPLSAPRGRYAWQTVQVEAADPFGLFATTLELPTPGELLVTPAIPRASAVPLRVGQTIHSSGPVPARLAGAGVDFWGTREYHPGDALRWLVWRRLAREPGKLYTKEFEKHEIADVGLIVDARGQTDLPAPVANAPSLFEHSVQAAAGLADAFLRAGDRVSLLVFGDVLLRAFPGYGKAQLQRILACLAGATTGTNISIETLKYLPVRLFPSRSQLIFISPLAPGDASAILRLRAFGYSVLLLSPDPVDFTAPSAPAEVTAALGRRAARVERALQTRQLRAGGVEVVSWRVDRPLAEALQRGLLRPGLRGNLREQQP